jgi:hypothetical protein
MTNLRRGHFEVKYVEAGAMWEPVPASEVKRAAKGSFRDVGMFITAVQDSSPKASRLSAFSWVRWVDDGR